MTRLLAAQQVSGRHIERTETQRADGLTTISGIEVAPAISSVPTKVNVHQAIKKVGNMRAKVYAELEKKP